MVPDGAWLSVVWLMACCLVQSDVQRLNRIGGAGTLRIAGGSLKSVGMFSDPVFQSFC